ncbi:hypothetical protein QNH32_01360 [Priestia flexa]|uniref:hypothetical protein n=1 Tax=Priestia flexa TaxID=86664 RepID=UPI0024BF6EEC|nr:hypothetical protein [Priestia flexa]WHX79328.1 hypothetical protein QNH32_01360 [Priestia flexa]
MNLKGLIIAGTKGRYGKSRITIDVYFQGGLEDYRRSYCAFAKSKNGVEVEYGATPLKAIQKAKNKALSKQEFIIEKRKGKVLEPKHIT